MAKNIEIELKLLCTDPSVWEDIMIAQSLLDIAVPESASRQLLDARYFDTSTYCLQKEKIAYRIRREGEQWVATVKGGGSSQGGLHERQEWNVIVGDAQPDITVFAGTEIGEKLIDLVGNQELAPILITRFERRSLEVCMADGSLIEVAADQGEIIAGHKVTPILEVELELKAGSPAALFTLGAALAKEYALLPETDSKFYRGLVLAGLVTTKPKDSVLPPVYKEQGANLGLPEVLTQLIIQFFAMQQAFLEHKSQPERLHELRICLRRLRSILEFIGPEFVDNYNHYQDELRKLGKMLGVLREIDVAYASWKQWSECQEANMLSKISLGRMLSQRRVVEAEKIHGLLYHGHGVPILLELWATLAAKQEQESGQVQVAIGDYVGSRFSDFLVKVMKQGKKVEWSDRAKVRKLRLQVKKIRYAAEVFQPVLEQVDELSPQLEVMQENLGLLRDIHSTEMLLKKLVKGTTSKVLQLEAGMFIGWQGRESLYKQEQMKEHWKNFYRTAPKWV